MGMDTDCLFACNHRHVDNRYSSILPTKLTINCIWLFNIKMIKEPISLKLCIASSPYPIGILKKTKHPSNSENRIYPFWMILGWSFKLFNFLWPLIVSEPYVTECSVMPFLWLSNSSYQTCQKDSRHIQIESTFVLFQDTNIDDQQQ